MRRSFAASFVDVKVAGDLSVDRKQFVGVNGDAKEAGVTEGGNSKEGKMKMGSKCQILIQMDPLKAA